MGSSTGTISIIRTNDNTFVDTIHLADDLDLDGGIAFSLDSNYVYIVNRGDDKVLVLRISDYTVVDMIDVGNLPAHIISVSLSDGNYMYVGSDDGNVSVIRTSDNTVVHTINVGGSPRGMAVSP